MSRFSSFRLLSAVAAGMSACVGFCAAVPSGFVHPVKGQEGQGGSTTTFNPRISAVGDFRWNLGDTIDDEERALLKELEFAVVSAVDPYLRAEIYFAIAREDDETEVELEEAFGVYDNLGRGLSAKFGKIAAAAGRVQRNHADQLNFLDYPLVVQDFLGEEGFRAAGASLSYLFPGERFFEFTLEALDPEESPLFGMNKSTSPVVLGHARTFFDFSADTSAQLGATFATGESDFDKRVNLWGVDFTAKWQPEGRGRSAVFETEAFWADGIDDGLDDTFGFFGALTYELQPRFFLTGKYDYSEIPGGNDKRHGWSAGLTFKVTEFHHWRLEYQTINSNFESTRNVLTLQFQWNIGAHPAHKY